MRAIDAAEELDLVTQDMLIGESGRLEQFHWFVRAHLEAPDGSLTTGDARTEKAAQRRPHREGRCQTRNQEAVTPARELH